MRSLPPLKLCSAHPTTTHNPRRRGCNPETADTSASSYAQHTAGHSTASRWLSPFLHGTNQAESDLDATSDGIYQYRYRFYFSADLASYLNINEQGIVGRWSSDNQSIASFLSTTPTDPTLLTWNHSISNPHNSFREWSQFEMKGFRAGWNELKFTVTNIKWPGGNPTGLRVEFTSVPAGVPVVPEPFTMALGAGALALAAARKRAKNKKSK